MEIHSIGVKSRLSGSDGAGGWGEAGGGGKVNPGPWNEINLSLRLLNGYPSGFFHRSDIFVFFYFLIQLVVEIYLGLEKLFGG